MPYLIKRPNPNNINDPSEAVDSENILPAIDKHFPHAEVIKTGGVIYHLALNDVIYNFDEKDEKDKKVLQELLTLEESCIEDCETHYAVCLCLK